MVWVGNWAWVSWGGGAGEEGEDGDGGREKKIIYIFSNNLEYSYGHELQFSLIWMKIVKVYCSP